jgi:hypothetical protein
MKRHPMTARVLFVAGFATALLSSLGCGGGSDSGGGPVPPSLACTDAGTVPPDTVTMSCGGLIDSTTERVDIVIGGPASGTTTLRGINFDVTYDPTKLEFVPEAVPSSPLFPDALVLTVLANGQQGRVVAAIQQVGTLPDVSIAAGEHWVIPLSFRRVAAATFDPTPLTFERTQATGASTAITFTNGLALAYP